MLSYFFNRQGEKENILPVYFSLGLKVFILFLVLPTYSSWAQTAPIPWYVSNLLSNPPIENPNSSPVVIAVIDDGFRLTHSAIKDFLHQNALEVPNNKIDDDGNGYPDDITGWDISDQDPDPSLLEGRENTFFHGTYIVGVITNLLKYAYGKDASTYFKILPVKALSDQAQSTFLKDGYKALKYAIDQKPDIIVCGWNGGFMPSEEQALIQKAHSEGIIFLASAGNFNSNSPNFPAAHPNFYTIAAVDSDLHKMDKSNYGSFVDLSGPGMNVLGAGSLNDQDLRIDGESSGAVAAVAATFAQLIHAFPNKSPNEILLAIKNTAIPIDTFNLSFAGKLGAGFPQVGKAYSYLKNELNINEFVIPEGQLSSKMIPAKSTQFEWRINPSGNYKGINFIPSFKEWEDHASISFFDGKETFIKKFDKDSQFQKIFIPGNQAIIRFNQLKKRKIQAFTLDFEAVPIDSSTLYCRSIKYYELPKANISDGSEDQNYSNSCSCKWQIQVAPGKRVRLKFLNFDTEAKTDFVYLFDGTNTIPQNLIAKFSGPNIPPTLISRTNQVLVWFVTDNKNTASGWTLAYEVFDDQ